MEKDTLMKLSYKELMELYRSVREEIRRRNEVIVIKIKEKPWN